jgi:hypothetical protein
MLSNEELGKRKEEGVWMCNKKEEELKAVWFFWYFNGYLKLLLLSNNVGLWFNLWLSTIS